MIDAFRCPLCKEALQDKNTILMCENAHQWPVIEGQLFFLPLFKNTEWTGNEIKRLNEKLQDNNFLAYARLKKLRKIVEPYAQIQPFNESFQSLLPFIETLKKRLKPGDLILDTWCRTGFSGDFLAQRFPAQEVISVWEGDNSVLGYKGFQACFTQAKKADNHHIVFHEPNKPLPFKDNQFAFVYGYDSLHRYKNIVDEAFRVAKPDAIISFPHVHLANSEPVPYFERGGILRTGQAYYDWIGQHDKLSSRKVTIHSEANLYLSQFPTKLSNDMNTAHYNGFVWIADENAQQINPKSQPLKDSDRVLVNPLFHFNNCGTSLSKDDNAEHVFTRHSMLSIQYEQNLKAIEQLNISLGEPDNLLQLKVFATKHELCLQDIQTLANNKVIFVTPMSKAMIMAQGIHMNSDIDRFEV